MRKVVDWIQARQDTLRTSLSVAAVLVVTVIGVQLFIVSRADSGPNLYLASSTTTVQTNAEVSVTVHADSGSEVIRAVQTSLGYDATQLQFVGLLEEGPFTQVLASDSSTAGIVRVARGIPSDSAAVSGDNTVVTLRFKVLAATGTPAISFDESASLMVRSPDSVNILAATTGTTLTVGTSSTTSTGRLSLEPVTLSAQKDGTFALTLKENSGTEFVTFVQANITYDAAKLQYVSMTEGNTFTTQAATDTDTPGVIRIGRGIPVGGGGVSGQNSVVTLTFKMLADSGNASVSLDKEESLLVTSTGGRNILGFVDNSTVTVAATATEQSATLSMAPSSGSYAKDATVAVTIRANSNTLALSTVQAVINYPTSQLEYISTTNSSVFPTSMRTSSSNGTIDIIRGISGGAQGVTGSNTVVTLHFKVIGASGTAGLTFAPASALFDTSGSGANILDLAASQGANYAISSANASCTDNPTVPGAVSRTNSSYTSISLSWEASTAATNCTLNGYHVFRGSTLIADVTDGTSYSDSGLTAGTSYLYTIQAFDSAGHTSASSTAVSLSTKTDDQSPLTPTGFTATASSSATITLNWSASTDLPNPGGAGVIKYFVYRNNAATPTYTVTNGTSLIDANVDADTTYTYTIAAVDAVNNISAPSNVISVKTAPPACSGTPTVPQDLSVTETTLTTARISWSPSTASTGCALAGYKIYRGSELIGTTTSTSFTDENLLPNTIYAYTVRAFDLSSHNSDPSPAVTATTQADTTPPSTPAAVAALAISAGQVNLSWSQSTDNLAVEKYRVYRNDVLISSLSATASSYSDTSVNPDSNYKYEVSAVDASNNESTKSVAAPNPLHTPVAQDLQAPTQPDNLRTLARTTNTIALAWDASTDNVGVAGYHVYRGGVKIADTTNTTYTDSGLTPDTAYSYTVRAFDADGNESSTSSPHSVRTMAVPQDSLVGDLNNDDKVDIFDLSILLKHWQQADVPPQSGELNNDGKVDSLDLGLLLSHYGEER